MRKKLIPLVVVALGVAGVATVLLYGLIADRFGNNPGAKASAQLVVAARPVDRGKILENADLRLVEAPCPHGTSKSCFTAAEALIGRTALVPILPGQPLVASIVSSPETGTSPSASIPVGYRAATLHPADSSGVISMLRSGDRVDLQVIDSDRVTQHAPLTVQRVWPGVEVLQVLPPDPSSVWPQRPVVTVLLAPRDAEQVGLSDTTGRIRLVLRNRDESGAAKPASPAPTAAIPAAIPAAVPAGKAVAAAPVAKPEPPAPGDNYRVRLISVNPEALGDLGAGTGSLQPKIEAQNRSQLDEALNHLYRDKSAQVIADRPLVASATPRDLLLDADGGSRPGANTIRLRLRSTGQGRLKIEPEARVAAPQGTAARRAEEELALGPGQAVLVSSLIEHREGRPVLPGEGGPREPRLVLVITPAP